MKFVAPDSIPKNVSEYVRKKMIDLTDYKKGTNTTASIQVSNKKIYKVNFLPLNIVKYYDAENSIEISNSETNNALALPLGTQNIPLGWFDDTENFGPPFEQPYFDIYLGTSSAYMTQIKHKKYDWGYSSHIFEPNSWKDCYGKYTQTTQKVRLFINEMIYTNIYFYGCDFTNMEYNYYGRYFEGTTVPVDNNATEYQVTFRIDFEPSYITGPSLICNDQPTTFILHSNSYPVSSIVWTQSENFTYISGQGTENYIVKANANGKGWINAKLLTTCGEVPLDTLYVNSGTPSYYTIQASYTSGGSTNWLQDNNCLLDYTFPGMYSGSIDIVDQGANTITWTKVSQSAGTSYVSFSSSNHGKHANITIKPLGSSAIYKMKAANQCGSYIHNYTFKASTPQTCEVMVEIMSEVTVSISPNPAAENVTVNVAETQTQTSWSENNQSEKQSKEPKSYTLRVYNNYGFQVYTTRMQGLSSTFSTSNLLNGLYIIDVSDGENSYKKQLIVKH